MQSSLKTLFMLLCLSYEFNGKSFNCSLENFQKCMASLQEVTKSEKLAFATTKEELTNVCQQLQEGFYCVENHSKRCFSPSQKRLFDSVVSGSRNVIEDLCVSGVVQENYLRYAKCFKNVSTDKSKCATQYHRMVQLSESEEDINDEVEDGLKETCCCFCNRQLSNIIFWYSDNGYYLRYAKCFKNVSTDKSKCATQYHRMVQLSESEEDINDEVEDGLKETCCAFTEFVHCKYTHTVKDCGQDAGNFLQNHMDRMSGSLIHQHCSLYTFQSDACGTANIILTINEWWMIFSIVLAWKICMLLQ
ncbi:uncharacterized protein LOC111640397 [Centruroides sculpturatus]|uniref:uncharacterized protein LOC111640397 n=1 Tax=Centruroides sculpturatus TaxID=218467 RepID=UPI000C6EE1A5|nr:uncharacterized protein LOC111640397 [Centruroides sculpturatus]